MPALGDVYEVKVQSYMQNQLGENVSHWVVTVPGASTDTQLAVAMTSALEPSYLNWMSPLAVLQAVTVQKIWPLPRLIYNEVLIGTPGGNGTVALPPQTSGLIETFTGLAGAHNRGHIYVPFPSLNNLDQTVLKYGNVNASGVTFLNAIGTAYMTPVVAAGGTVLTYGVFNRATHVHTVLGQFEAKDLFATQKRRSYFGRPNVFPI